VGVLKQVTVSVADSGCLSLIPDLNFFPSQIPDLGSRISDLGSKNSNKREGSKYVIQPFLEKILKLSSQKKIVIKHSKIWVCGPRSGILIKHITDPGSRGQKGTGSRIRIRNTGYRTANCARAWQGRRSSDKLCFGEKDIILPS
jgi:hypothetical protein